MIPITKANSWPGPESECGGTQLMEEALDTATVEAFWALMESFSDTLKGKCHFPQDGG